MYAVIQDHEVVEYFSDQQSADNEYLNCIDHDDIDALYVVKIVRAYNKSLDN
jgi:hypothetical protein